MKQTGVRKLGLTLSLGGLALFLLSGAPAAAQQVQANVEFSNVSQTDPHPVTYSWTWPNGQKSAAIDPTHYYTYFYTGSIDPDARVTKETKIERIPVTMEEWEANRKWIVLKLKYYYQITKSQPLTAMNEMSGDASAPVLTLSPQGTAVPGNGMNMMQPPTLNAGVVPAPLPVTPNGQPQPGAGGNGYMAPPTLNMQPVMPAAAPGAGPNAGFNADAAA